MTNRILAAALAAALLAAPAGADEIEDTLNAAIEAYRAGDVALAKEEAEFAAQLLAQQKAQGLSNFLPEALPGWEKEVGEVNAQAAAMFGGGMMANASYRKDDEYLEVQLMADNQMVASLAMMLGNPAMMGQMGQVRRIGRERVVLTNDGELQAMLDGRILVQISGNAPAEVKEAYFEAIDIAGLKAF